MWTYGLVPQLLRARVDGEDDIPSRPEHWRAAVYRHLIAGKVGRSFRLEDAYRVIRREGITTTHQDGRAATDTVSGWGEIITGWLEYLRDQGYVKVHHHLANRLLADTVEVLADFEHPPPTSPAAPPHTRVWSSNRPHVLQAPGHRQPALGSPDVHPPTAAAHPAAPFHGVAPRGVEDRDNPPPRQARATLRCQRCAKPLDPLLAGHGRHILC